MKEAESEIDFIDEQMTDLDTLLSYASVRSEILWVESKYRGGGALHLVLEDGNLEDVNIQYHLDKMEAGEWDGYAAEVEDCDKYRFIKLAKDLLEMKIPYRELIINGTYITEDLFDYLYNK